MVRRELHMKTGRSVTGQPFGLHLFEVVVGGGQPEAHDPDGLIHGVRWCGADEIESLAFTFAEDQDWLLGQLAHRATAQRGQGSAMAGKMVRDRIPELMATKGQPARFGRAEARDLPALLLAKVREEAAEVVASEGSIAELADLLDVVDALAQCLGHTAGDIQDARAEKLRSRGGFQRGIILMRAAAPDRAEGAAEG